MSLVGFRPPPVHRPAPRPYVARPKILKAISMGSLAGLAVRRGGRGGWVKVVEVSKAVGLGLVAPRGAPQGTTLLEEAPLFHRLKGQSRVEALEAFQSMGQEERQKLLSMAASPQQAYKELGLHGDDLQFIRVLSTNGVSVPRGGAAVYEISCRGNHSCKPNAALCVQEDATMRLNALRDIEPGESIQVSYIGEGDLLKPTGHRQRMLSSWGFKCNCERCAGQEDTRGYHCEACGTLNYRRESGSCTCCQADLPDEKLWEDALPAYVSFKRFWKVKRLNNNIISWINMIDYIDISYN